MQPTQRLNYLFVINPGSGKNTSGDITEIIENHFEGKASTFKIFLLDQNVKFKQLDAYIKKINPQQIIAAGGDGTITMIANMVAHTDIALGILPTGSANGMAKELNIPLDLHEALLLATSCKSSPCDLIKMNDHKYCLHLSDVGLNAHLIKHFDEGKIRGFTGYCSVVIKTLIRKQKIHATIYTPQKIIKRDAFMVAFANARMYGTGAIINPDGKLDDGIFEVIIVRKLNVWAVLNVMFKIGRYNPKEIEIVPATSVEITTSRKVHFQIDGEYEGRLNKVTAVIAPNALNLLRPFVKAKIF